MTQMECIQFSSAEQFLFRWEDDKQFDLLILDIEMNGISGMDLAARVSTQDEEIPILFITGYEKYMAQGYEVSAIQYLLKPVNKEKLFRVMDRLQKGRKQEDKLVFQTEEGALLLTPSDIWYAEAEGHNCILYAMQGSRYQSAGIMSGPTGYRLRHSMTELLKMFREHDCFVQCHRSYLVNLKHVAAIMRTEIVMDDQTKLPVSRGAYKSVNEAFIRNYGLKQ